MNNLDEILNRWAIWRFHGGSIDFEGYKSIFDTDNPVKGEVSSKGRLEKIPSDKRMIFVNSHIENELTDTERLVLIINYRADPRVPALKDIISKSSYIGKSDTYFRKTLCIARQKIFKKIC